MKRKVMGYRRGVTAAHLDLTRPGQWDEPGGGSVEKGVSLF